MEFFLIILALILLFLFIGFVIYCVIKKEDEVESIRPQYEKYLDALNKRIEYFKNHNAIFDDLDQYIIIDEKSIKILDAGMIPIELFKHYVTNNPDYTFWKRNIY